MNAQTLSGNVNRMKRKETESAGVSNEERKRGYRGLEEVPVCAERGQ